MRKLCLPYRKSLYFSVLTACCLGLFTSCFLKKSAEASSQEEASKPSLFNKARTLFQSCQVFESVLKTPVSEVPVRATLNRESEQLDLEIENLPPISFNAPLPPTDEFCKGEEETVALVQELLEKSIPACRIKFEDDSFLCTMRTESLEVSIKKVQKLKAAMLRTSQRPAYIFSRRLAFAENLAVLLRMPNWQERLAPFCAIVDSSLREELPLILTVEGWREKLCQTGDQDRSLSLALLALSKTVEELTLLSDLREEVTANGILSFRFPKSAVVGKRLRVQLEASADLKSELMSKLDQIRGDEESSNACWFPGIGQNHPSFELARSMGLLGHQDDSPCQERTGLVQEIVSDYVLKSLTAETQFTVTNGLGKVLALPMGDYDYFIYNASDEIHSEPDPKLIDRGVLSWTKKSRYLTIAKTTHQH